MKEVGHSYIKALQGPVKCVVWSGVGYPVSRVRDTASIGDWSMRHDVAGARNVISALSLHTTMPTSFEVYTVHHDFPSSACDCQLATASASASRAGTT